MNTFEQFGFTDPTEAIIRNSIEGQMTSIADNVIPGYFAGQMLSTLVWGDYSRKTAIKQTKKSIEFRQKILDDNIADSREQTKKEIEFMRECHNLGLQRQIEYAKDSCEQRLSEEEFRKFCEGTWLKHFRPTIGAILEEFRHPQLDSDGVIKMKLMIARTKLSSETSGLDKRGAYYDFCSDFKEDYLFDLNIDGRWLRAWENDCISPVADTMNLHYIMQGMPTILVFPMQRGEKFSVEVSTWAFQIGLSNMSINKVFQMPMAELSEHPNRLKNAMVAATVFIDDCYRLLFCQKKPNSIYQVEKELKKDSLVWELLCQKYKSMLDTISMIAIPNFSASNELKKLEKTIIL